MRIESGGVVELFLGVVFGEVYGMYKCGIVGSGEWVLVVVEVVCGCDEE